MKSWIEKKCRILKIEFLTLFYNSHISSDYVFDTLVQVNSLTCLTCSVQICFQNDLKSLERHYIFTFPSVKMILQHLQSMLESSENDAFKS